MSDQKRELRGHPVGLTYPHKWSAYFRATSLFSHRWQGLGPQLSKDYFHIITFMDFFFFLLNSSEVQRGWKELAEIWTHHLQTEPPEDVTCDASPSGTHGAGDPMLAHRVLITNESPAQGPSWWLLGRYNQMTWRQRFQRWLVQQLRDAVRARVCPFLHPQGLLWPVTDLLQGWEDLWVPASPCTCSRRWDTSAPTF